MRVLLDGQIALVTGAARGIGKAIADAFMDNGARRVIYADIDIDGARGAADTTYGFPIHMDVGDPESVAAAFQIIRHEFGQLDIVVNNAGVNTLEHRVTIDEFPLEEWERILRVDLTGLFLVSKEAASSMIPQGSGRIINVASVAGLVPLRLQSPFVAAKAGVVNLTRSMALELGSFGILVNCIAPGSILTDGTRTLFYGEDGKFRDSAEKLLAHIPLGRPGTPEEIAQAALFLADPENTYTNGAILTVDGGWTAGYAREF